MSADHENEGRSAPRPFSVDDAKERAQEAIRKSEFILSRAYGLLRAPSREWEQIKAEETTIQNILLGYIAPLAVIPPLCDLIGQSLFNYAMQVDFGQAVIRAVVTWIVSIGLVFFLGVLVNVLADTFEADPISHFRLRQEDYREIAGHIAATGLPVLVVMEGGYAVESLGANVQALLSGFDKCPA